VAALDVFLHAIRIQESGNNYTIGPNSSGASGAYQFTQGTWLQALGMVGLGNSVYSREQAYQAPASVQDAAAAALMSSYYNQFGQSWFNVAEAWYGGPAAVGHPSIGGGVGFPNVGQYAADVIAIYNSLGGTVTTPIPLGVPTLTQPMTAQFMSDVGVHYTGITGPLWSKWDEYANTLQTSLVKIPTKLV
jgi:hypothetical protein